MDLRGACRAHATPYGTQFFCFHIHFHQKVPALGVHAPQRVHAPLREILDSPLSAHNVRLRLMAYCVKFVLFTADTDSPVSTEIPLSGTQPRAMEFSWWQQIGLEFLVKSNINNWIACTPGGK